MTREFREAQKKLQEIDRASSSAPPAQSCCNNAERLEGFGEGAKAVLQGRLDGALAGSKATTLTQGLDIKPEHAAALEAILGSAVEAISVLDGATAQRILAQLGAGADRRRRAAGRRSRCAARRHDGALPPGLIPATSVVGVSSDDHPVLALLEACYVADDLNAFLEYWKANPGFSFLAVAHRSGYPADQRGLVSGGYRQFLRTASCSGKWTCAKRRKRSSKTSCTMTSSGRPDRRPATSTDRGRSPA
ncbi:MAG: hypothetical protein U1F61_20185 [Opitutaceae bacterium]